MCQYPTDKDFIDAIVDSIKNCEGTHFIITKSNNEMFLSIKGARFGLQYCGHEKSITVCDFYATTTLINVRAESIDQLILITLGFIEIEKRYKHD